MSLSQTERAKLGSQGGKQAAKNLTPEQRAARARTAGKVKSAKKKEAAVKRANEQWKRWRETQAQLKAENLIKHLQLQK
jgi:predicted ribonuclease toxin of YeeF-YezG toxin-antitoxin module